MMSAVAVGTLLAGPASRRRQHDFDRGELRQLSNLRVDAGDASPSFGEQRIHAAVDQQLRQGLLDVTESPSVYIATHVITKEQQPAERLRGSVAVRSSAAASTRPRVSKPIRRERSPSTFYDARPNSSCGVASGSGTRG